MVGSFATTSGRSTRACATASNALASPPGDITQVLRVGVLPSNAHELRPYWDAFRTRHPHWGLRIRHNPYVDAFTPLRDGHIDVLVAWLPIEEPDLMVGPEIFTEPMVVLVPPDHPLADHDSASAEVLGEHAIPKAPWSPDRARYHLPHDVG